MPLVVLVERPSPVSLDAGKAGVANPGRAWILRDPLRVHVRRQQQRQRLRAASPPTRRSTTWPRASRCGFGRFWPIVAILAIAGSLARKARLPASAGTMPTHGPTFVILLIGTVLLVGAAHFRAGARPRACR